MGKLTWASDPSVSSGFTGHDVLLYDNDGVLVDTVAVSEVGTTGIFTGTFSGVLGSYHAQVWKGATFIDRFTFNYNGANNISVAEAYKFAREAAELMAIGVEKFTNSLPS